MRKHKRFYGGHSSAPILGSGLMRLFGLGNFAVGLALFAGLLIPLREACAGAGPITYVYDSAGRMIEVVDGSGAAAFYNYSVLGELLSISTSAPSQIEIFKITPTLGGIGASVTLYGSNFGPTASQNTVNFGSTTASIVSASPTTIVFTVPNTQCGLPGCSVSVTAPAGTSNSVNFLMF